MDFNLPQETSFETYAFLFALFCVVCISEMLMTPPSIEGKRLWKQDRIAYFTGGGALLFRRAVTFIAVLYHGLFVLFPRLRDPTHGATDICPNPSALNPQLFTWNWYTAGCFALVLIGAPIRFMAFSHLGKNFTFKLTEPDGLVTSGVYRYMQHPSYTGLVPVVGGDFLLFLRWDGTLGCWLPAHVRTMLNGWGVVSIVAIVLHLSVMLAKRVADEESMMKQLFGKEWEDWHQKTKRFIPGIF